MANASAAIAALAAAPAAGTVQPATPPTAAQIARFEQLVYLEPAAASAAPAADFRAAFDQVAKVGADFRAVMQPPAPRDPALTAQISPEVLASLEIQQMMVVHTLAHMNFTYVTKMIELTQTSMRTLYQQQG